MCLTQFDPILSATNSTVLRSEGGWLWKKAWASCACEESGVCEAQLPYTLAPARRLSSYLESLAAWGKLGPQAGGGGGCDFPHKTPTPSTAA